MSFEYLGQAIKYPIELKNGSGVLTSGKELIKQSIADILSTPKGTKFFLPEYGSRIRQLIFEQNDEVLEDLLTLFIFEALQEWEQRAKFTGVSFNRLDNRTDCIISYRILNSNEIDSYIFPFYRSLKY